MSSLPATMKAVVFHGPKKVAVEERPVPKSKYSPFFCLDHLGSKYHLDIDAV